MTNKEVFNIQICYMDGYTNQSFGVGFEACFSKACKLAIDDYEIEQVNIREIKGDWPIVASLIMYKND